MLGAVSHPLQVMLGVVSQPMWFMLKTIPYTPQQNGVVERKNRSLKEMATCMMEAKTLPPNFWAKAIKCASYIEKKVHHKNLDVMTPFKAWSGHKPDVTHFRIFGSKAWDRIPIEKRKALQPQSQECLFVGYFEDSKGYNLINLSTKNPSLKGVFSSKKSL